MSIVSLIVVTHFQLRVRSGDQSLEGNVDLQVLLELAAHGLVGTYALSRIRLISRGSPRPLGVVVALYFAFLSLSVLHSPVPLFAVVRLGLTACVLLLSIALVQLGTRERFHAAMHGYLIVILIAVAGGFATGFNYERQEGRYTFWNTHPNSSATLLSFALVLVVHYLWADRSSHRSPRSRWAYGTLFVIYAVALFMTGSRTLLLATVVGTLVVLWLSIRRRIDFAAVGALIVTCILVVGSSTLSEVVQRGQEAEDFSKLSSRTDLWNHSLDLIDQHRWLGQGYASSREAFTYEFSGVGGAHNAVLEIAVDAGVITGLLFLAVIVTCFWTARGLIRAQHIDGPLLIGLLTVFVIRGLTEHGLGQLGTPETVWLLCVVSWLLVADDEVRSRRLGRPRANG